MISIRSHAGLELESSYGLGFLGLRDLYTGKIVVTRHTMGQKMSDEKYK